VGAPWGGSGYVNRRHGRSDGLNLTDITDGVDASRSESYFHIPTNRLQHATGHLISERCGENRVQ
jgi:hypothetical protein